MPRGRVFFDRHAKPTPPAFVAQAVRTGRGGVTTGEDGTSPLFFAPVRNEDKCRRCHDEEGPPARRRHRTDQGREFTPCQSVASARPLNPPSVNSHLRGCPKSGQPGHTAALAYARAAFASERPDGLEYESAATLPGVYFPQAVPGVLTPRPSWIHTLRIPPSLTGACSVPEIQATQAYMILGLGCVRRFWIAGEQPLQHFFCQAPTLHPEMNHCFKVRGMNCQSRQRSHRLSSLQVRQRPVQITSVVETLSLQVTVLVCNCPEDHQDNCHRG